MSIVRQFLFKAFWSGTQPLKIFEYKRGMNKIRRNPNDLHIPILCYFIPVVGFCSMLLFASEYIQRRKA